MADWVAHVLVMYAAVTVLAWRYERVTPALVSVAMAGALIPDLRKVKLVLPEATVEAALGVPFSWAPLHQLGGVVVVIAIGTALVPRGHRSLVCLFLSLGASSHVFLDHFLFKPDGLAFGFLWPLTTYRIPVEGFYLSWDRWPAVVALVVAATVWTATRLRERPMPMETPADSPTPALPPAPGSTPSVRRLTDGGTPRSRTAFDPAADRESRHQSDGRSPTAD